MGFAQECESVLSAGWYDDQGKREEMEDGYIFIDNYGSQEGNAYVGVYDGHGGRETVSYLEKFLHQDIMNAFSENPFDNIHNCFKKAFQVADERLCQDNNCKGSGSTACVLFLMRKEEKIICCHVGDSRAVLCRDGIGVRLTSEGEHKANDVREQMYVLEKGGTIFNERVEGVLSITRAFGNKNLKKPQMENNIISNEPDVTYLHWNKGTDMFIIVACDGMWDVMDDQTACLLVLEAMEMLLENNTVQDPSILGEMLSHLLVEEALARGSMDNVTAMVILL